MPDDTLTLALEGEVSLNDFSSTIQHFTSLIEALTKEIATETKISWIIDELETGSALATVRGEAEAMEAVHRVAHAYLVIGSALEKQQIIPYSETIQKKALAITQILDGNITSIRFETSRGEASIASKATKPDEGPPVIYSLGFIKGKIETLTKRRGLKFILYDSIFDRAMSCYLNPTQEEKIRDAWGKKVMVSGRIGRDKKHGRPIVVRDIVQIKILEDVEPGSYRNAKGAVLWQEGDDPSEVIVRRIRDAC